jgi:hypothetical protein
LKITAHAIPMTSSCALLRADRNGASQSFELAAIDDRGSAGDTIVVRLVLRLMRSKSLNTRIVRVA